MGNAANESCEKDGDNKGFHNGLSEMKDTKIFGNCELLMLYQWTWFCVNKN
jgi:hypothetical protein